MWFSPSSHYPFSPAHHSSSLHDLNPAMFQPQSTISIRNKSFSSLLPTLELSSPSLSRSSFSLMFSYRYWLSTAATLLMCQCVNQGHPGTVQWWTLDKGRGLKVSEKWVGWSTMARPEFAEMGCMEVVCRQLGSKSGGWWWWSMLVLKVEIHMRIMWLLRCVVVWEAELVRKGCGSSACKKQGNRWLGRVVVKGGALRREKRKSWRERNRKNT